MNRVGEIELLLVGVDVNDLIKLVFGSSYITKNIPTRHLTSMRRKFARGHQRQ